MSIQIKEIAFTGYPVTDVPRARAFYGKTLGLKETHAVEFGAGKWWVEYDIGPGTLAIHSYSAPAPDGKGPSIAFEVEDLDEALADLKSKGVPIVEGIPGTVIIDSPVCRFFFITDPDGTPIIIHQHK